MSTIKTNFNLLETGDYIYNIKYPTFEENLCYMEMKCLFNSVPPKNTNYFFTKYSVDPSRSPFIKFRITTIFIENSYEDIIEKIKTNNFSSTKFKVSFIKISNTSVDYNKRCKIERLIGFNINGKATIHGADTIFSITEYNGKWIFGEFEKNNADYFSHNSKPCSYSNALTVRTARAIVNIAVGNDLSLKVIDPCCGIGTVIIEALSMNINIKGYEINPSIAENARRNLDFFGFEDVITTGDINAISEEFDVAIIDLPYGLFSPTTLENQINIIKSGRRICKRLILVTLDDMTEHLISNGFKIIDKCYVLKGKFKRSIIICE